MKYIYLLLMPFILFSQQSLQDIQEAELKSAMAFHSFENETYSVNGNIDVLHYTLNLFVDPASTSLSGNTDVKFKVLEATDEVALNASSQYMTISDVVLDGVSLMANSTHADDVLTITVPTTLAVDEIKTINVSYTANAHIGYRVTNHQGTPAISTLSQPYFAKEWYVCKDDLNDKADEGVDVYISHPAGNKGASNGLLVETVENIDGSFTDHWKHSYPIPAYLVGIAVANYAEYNNSVTLGDTTIPIVNYIFPENDTPATHTILDGVPVYMEYLYDLFGDYPYALEKYGHAQWAWGGGMEHSTMSFMEHFGENLTIHELAHQWFGDKITCGTWNDIWLNEGFATYCSGLYYDYTNNQGAFYSWKNSVVNALLDEAVDGSVYIPEGTELTLPRIFSYTLSYQKGAIVLHMLRMTIGDDAFYQGVQNYLTDPNLEYEFALTPQLQAHLETASGMDLQEFFNDWVYGEGYPEFDLALDSHTDGTYTLTTYQTPISGNASVDLFETNIEVGFLGTSGQYVLKEFSVNALQQSFDIDDIDFNVINILFNPNKNYLADLGTVILDVEDVENQQIELTISPNPAKDFFTIKTDENIQEIKVFSTSGQLVYENNTVSIDPIISIQNWNQGIYIVEITTDSGKATEKLMVN